MAVDDVALRTGLVLLIVGSLVGAAVWAPAYAAAVLGLLLTTLSQTI